MNINGGTAVIRRWGRAWESTMLTSCSSFLIMALAPLLVIYFYLCCVFYQGAISTLFLELVQGKTTLKILWGMLPVITQPAIIIYGIWLALQVFLALIPDILHRFVKNYQGGLQKGGVTPAGNRLTYNINGLQAWIISHLIFFAGIYYFQWISPTIIFDNWGELLWVTSITGNVVALAVYMKALYSPTHPADRKRTYSFFYDYFMGIELNPRLGKFDIKLFFNGRPGIIAWTMINFSFAAAQYQKYGTVTNSMILINVFHAVYVLYFFWKESWYLKTIDIAHDHFGWMLAWGDCTWLPYMYTLQGLYLVYHPVELSTSYFIFVLAFWSFGNWIFITANNQKDLFRATNGEAEIWGKKPEFIRCEYAAGDGQTHESKLLVSGWWGFARHFNYTGDLMGSLAYGLACGFDSVIPYFYFVFMLVLLIHRCLRDEQKCRNKYNGAWEKYTKCVPYRLVPGVF